MSEFMPDGKHVWLAGVPWRTGIGILCNLSELPGAA
jgi:hypothetical protein